MIGKTALSTVSLTAIAVAATMLAAPAAPAAASAAPVASAASALDPVPVTSCGTTISGDAYLPHDLACAGGTGVTVTDSGTLNLRGHRLIGPGRSAAGFGTSVGVELATPQEAAAVRVRNGTLTGWDTAVQMFDTGPVRADRLVVKHGRVGFDAIGGAVTIVHSRLVDLGSGVTSLFGAVTVRRSAVSGSGQGVNVSQARATVEHSLIRGNQNGVNCGEAACVVTDSALLGNEFAVFLYNFGSVQMDDDVVAGNTTGVLAGDAGNTHVADISTTRFIRNGTGVRIDPTAGVTIQDSRFAHNEVGVYAQTSTDPIFDFHARPTLLRNVFRRNGDGVLITDPQSSSTLGGNRAFWNRGWGLFVAGQVTDLGGNVARHNGNPAQCYGVTCTTG